MLRDMEFCNLSEVVVRPEDDLDSLLDGAALGAKCCYLPVREEYRELVRQDVVRFLEYQAAIVFQVSIGVIKMSINC